MKIRISSIFCMSCIVICVNAMDDVPATKIVAHYQFPELFKADIYTFQKKGLLKIPHKCITKFIICSALRTHSWLSNPWYCFEKMMQDSAMRKRIEKEKEQAAGDLTTIMNEKKYAVLCTLLPGLFTGKDTLPEKITYLRGKLDNETLDNYKPAVYESMCSMLEQSNKPNISAYEIDYTFMTAKEHAICTKTLSTLLACITDDTSEFSIGPYVKCYYTVPFIRYPPPSEKVQPASVDKNTKKFCLKYTSTQEDNITHKIIEFSFEYWLQLWPKEHATRAQLQELRDQEEPSSQEEDSLEKSDQEMDRQEVYTYVQFEYDASPSSSPESVRKEFFDLVTESVYDGTRRYKLQ